MKKFLLILAIVFSLIIHHTPKVYALNLEDGRIIISQIYSNVTGDEQEEIIVLSGIRLNDTSLYENLKINVFEDKSGKLLYSVIPTVNYGLDVSLVSVNFSGKDKSQIFFKTKTDNKNNCFYVYDFSLNQKTVYDCELDVNTFNAKHLDYYKILISGKNEYRVDIYYKDKNYLSKLYQKSGKLQKQAPIKVTAPVDAIPFFDGEKWNLSIIRNACGYDDTDVYAKCVKNYAYNGKEFIEISESVAI